MGRPFANDLASLPSTYEWARDYPISSLAKAVEAVRDFPLIAIGSGGSLTAAAFMAMLHERFTGMMAKHATPLEAVESPSIQSNAVAVLSARGSNPDVVRSSELLASREPKAIIGLVLSKDSHLATLPKHFPWVTLEEIESPLGKDGFLATKSLLATCVLLYRAYCAVFAADDDLPGTLPEAKVRTRYNGDMSPNAFKGLANGTICALFGGWAKIAAIDLESKFTEAGLIPVQPADFRNFAHGRHYWLARHPGTTSVVSMTTAESRGIAKRTLSALPAQTPIIELEASSAGPVGSIELLVSVFRLTGEVAANVGVDAGKPTVPAFGRQLYRQGIPPGSAKLSDHILRRKLGEILERWPEDVVQTSREALSTYLDRLMTVKIGGVVLDYDGTLCPPENRFERLPLPVCSALSRLLEEGLLIGVATGRGKSVRRALCEGISSEHWGGLIVGYYNGSEILKLDQGDPTGGDQGTRELEEFVDRLRGDALLSRVCSIEARPHQVSLVPNTKISVVSLYQLVTELLSAVPGGGLRAVRSAHSVDVLSAGVSKLKVKDRLANELAAAGPSLEILCIGDSGTWDGNDFQLLSEMPSLSVDQVAHSLTHAWHIAPAGHRGLQATLDYLSALRSRDKSFTFDLSQLMERKL